MDRNDAISYIATTLAIRIVERYRANAPTDTIPDSTGRTLARIAHESTQAACNALGIGEAYRETVTHLAKCNGVKL